MKASFQWKQSRLHELNLKFSDHLCSGSDYACCYVFHEVYICARSLTGSWACNVCMRVICPTGGGEPPLVWTDTLLIGWTVIGPPALRSHGALSRILTNSSSPMCLFNGTINMKQPGCRKTTFSSHITGTTDARRPGDTCLLPSPHVCGHGWRMTNNSHALMWDSCT